MNYETMIQLYDEGNFVFHATIELGVPENKAIADWRNTHRVGKYVICESRSEEKRKCKRLYIRNVTNTFLDAYKKNGWWNTFTLCENDVPTGLWLCVTREFRIDKNGYVNMIVDAVAPIPELKKHFFLEAKEGSWNSPAIKLMLGSGKFLPEYEFQTYNNLNVDELRNRFQKYANLEYSELCDAVLKDWLAEKISLTEIENALNEKTPYEKMVISVQMAIAKGTIEKDFSQYPLFAKKISRTENHEGLFHNTVGYYKVESYIERNVCSYYDLVANGEMVEIESDYPLDIVEAVLEYRERKKELEKQAKKAKRKNK